MRLHIQLFIAKTQFYFSELNNTRIFNIIKRAIRRVKINRLFHQLFNIK